ncbi:MAG: M48 family metallopeptidase [Cytophaga sp.]|uniref:M48 family metallopeptidase n=1 Tax=Cytophaga sp. TaxID=29535 RepID=UPI003F7D9CEA
MWISKKIFLFSALLLVGSSLSIVACKRVAVTNRSQLSLIPESQMIAMSSEQYAQVIKQGPLSTNQTQVAMVKRVGNTIKTAVEKYMAEQGRSKELEGYNWEFNLIQNDTTVNAWCMPGGKVAFYTAILPVCVDENGVAVVMGHEVAHAIAHHGNERMSQGILAQAGGEAIDIALSNKSAATRQLFDVAYGAGAQYGVILPFSRKHESEADKMGLVFMAMAGYDPHVAVDFWKRMSAVSGGQAPPEFMSTHPSDARRVADLEAFLPEAMKYYKPK